MKFIVTVVVGSLENLMTTYCQEVRSRGFPVIRIHEGIAKIVMQESEDLW